VPGAAEFPVQGRVDGVELGAEGVGQHRFPARIVQVDERQAGAGQGTLTSGASTPKAHPQVAGGLGGGGVAVVDLLGDAAWLLAPAAEHGMPNHQPGP
jgi:hypothetical protein